MIPFRYGEAFREGSQMIDWFRCFPYPEDEKGEGYDPSLQPRANANERADRS